LGGKSTPTGISLEAREEGSGADRPGVPETRFSGCRHQRGKEAGGERKAWNYYSYQKKKALEKVF